MTLRHTALAALLAAAGTAALAAPYASRYSGTIGTSTHPAIHSGQGYSLTLVFDNGGTSAASQHWEGVHLRCAIWRMNDAGDVTYVQDLAAHPPAYTLGAVNTEADGTLALVFSAVLAQNVPPAHYSGTGGLHGDVNWLANGANDVFGDNAETAQPRTMGDLANGVQMNAPHWSAPQRVTAACDDTPYTAPPAPTPVPTLGHASLVLLAGLLGALARRMFG